MRLPWKDDLIGTIWDGRVVSDAALTTRVNVARCVIGYSGEEQRLIKTLPKKGFRFVGVVQEIQSALSVAVTDINAELPKPALSLPDKPSLNIAPFELARRLARAPRCARLSNIGRVLASTNGISCRSRRSKTPLKKPSRVPLSGHALAGLIVLWNKRLLK